MSDPWAAAQSNTSTTAGTATTGRPAESQVVPQGESQLFGGQGGERHPSLFNKTHALGTVRTGVIVGIRDVQSRFYSTDGAGDLKFWENTLAGKKGQKPVPEAMGKDGKPNRPVMDTHITVQTEYRMDAAEAVAVNRSPDYVEEDTGLRVFVPNDMKATQLAVTEYNATVDPAQRIVSNATLIGKRLFAKRVGQKPNPGGNPSWINEVKFSAE